MHRRNSYLTQVRNSVTGRFPFDPRLALRKGIWEDPVMRGFYFAAYMWPASIAVVTESTLSG